LKDRPSRFDVVLEFGELTHSVRHRYLWAFLRERDLVDELFAEADDITSTCTTIAEAQEQLVRWLQRAIEAGTPLVGVTSLAGLPQLEQPELQPQRPMGFQSHK